MIETRWYHADEGRALGPVSELELKNLVRQGRVNPATLTWRPGQAWWEPLEKVKPEVAALHKVKPAALVVESPHEGHPTPSRAKAESVALLEEELPFFEASGETREETRALVAEVESREPFSADMEPTLPEEEPPAPPKGTPSTFKLETLKTGLAKPAIARPAASGVVKPGLPKPPPTATGGGKGLPALRPPGPVPPSGSGSGGAAKGVPEPATEGKGLLGKLFKKGNF